MMTLVVKSSLYRYSTLVSTIEKFSAVSTERTPEVVVYVWTSKASALLVTTSTKPKLPVAPSPTNFILTGTFTAFLYQAPIYMVTRYVPGWRAKTPLVLEILRVTGVLRDPGVELVWKGTT
jgi:hypothetical protein